MINLRVLEIRVLEIRVLQIRVLQIRVLQIRVLQIQSVFYKSNPVRLLQYAKSIIHLCGMLLISPFRRLVYRRIMSKADNNNTIKLI